MVLPLIILAGIAVTGLIASRYKPKPASGFVNPDPHTSYGRFEQKTLSMKRVHKDRCWPIGNGRLACGCQGAKWFQMGAGRTCSTCKTECNRRRSIQTNRVYGSDDYPILIA